MNADTKQIIDNAVHYDCESLRLLALTAETLKDAKDREGIAYFESKVGRKVVVWARMRSRFPTWFDPSHADYRNATPDGVIGLSRLCQLPLAVCAKQYDAHKDHINEAGALNLINFDVNAAKPPRSRNGHGDDKTLADRIATHYYKLGSRIPSTNQVYDDVDFRRDVKNEPEVTAALAKRRDGGSETT